MDADISVDADIGIVAAASCLPQTTRTTAELFRDEGLELSAEQADRLGIDAVRVCVDETGSPLALRAARDAIRQSGLTPADIGVIVDYSVMPQEYLVPSWSMSNRLQHELGATRAFTVGFSGGGSTQLHVAIRFAVSLLGTDDRIETALLLGADVAIPGNRVINRGDPFTVLGDGATALVLRRGAERNVIVGTGLASNGDAHDVICIRGGAMNHPTRADLYRLELDAGMVRRHAWDGTLNRLTGAVLESAGIGLAEVACWLYPNISAADTRRYVNALGIAPDRIDPRNRMRYGHVQASDLVLNYLSAASTGAVEPGSHLLMSSHGMGFSFGVTLIRH